MSLKIKKLTATVQILVTILVKNTYMNPVVMLLLDTLSQRPRVYCLPLKGLSISPCSQNVINKSLHECCKKWMKNERTRSNKTTFLPLNFTKLIIYT